MGKVRVGVLRGGPSPEYDVSLKSGGAVLSTLTTDKYDVRDILIDKDGIWHSFGIPRTPADVLPHMDVVFLALHGEFGEDGGVQRLLDQFGVPYTGSQAFASALSMNKAQAKNIVKSLGVRVPEHRVINVDINTTEQIQGVVRDFGFPVIVKPVRGGSSLGITLAKNEDMLVEGIRKAFAFGRQVLVEPYIEGREATCGVIENFRGEPHYSLLPVEIIPDHEERLFDYDAKYSGRSKEICPANFNKDELREIERLAREVHKGLNLSHYSRSDFIVSPRGIYFLEVNTLPGLTAESLLPKSLVAVGSSLPEFLDHIVTLARR